MFSGKECAANVPTSGAWGLPVEHAFLPLHFRFRSHVVAIYLGRSFVELHFTFYCAVVEASPYRLLVVDVHDEPGVTYSCALFLRA